MARTPPNKRLQPTAARQAFPDRGTLGGVNQAPQRGRGAASAAEAPVRWAAQSMRSQYAIVFVLCALGCFEPRLEFHVVRSADSPIKTEVVEPGPCEDCVAQSWLAHDGTRVALQIERQPFLSVPAHRLSEAEIVHGKWLYRPYCDSFTLSFRLSISLAEMTDIAEKYSVLPAVAIVNDRVIDAGRHMVSGETVALAFTERQGAIEAAGSLRASPALREKDDSWREDVRRQQLEILKELFADPEKLRRFASESGLAVEGLKKEELAAQLFCP